MPLGHPIGLKDYNFPTPIAQLASYFNLLRGTKIVVSNKQYWIRWANYEGFPRRQCSVGAGQEGEGPFKVSVIQIVTSVTCYPELTFPPEHAR